MKLIILSTATICFCMQLFAQGPVLEWAKQIGSTYDDWGNSITIDAEGNVYTTGKFQGTVDFDPGVGVFNITSAGGNYNMFISKLDSSGNFVWVKQFGGDGYAEGLSITTDGTGNIYITGDFSGTIDFDTNSGNFNLTTLIWGNDIFVSKLDSSGDLVWVKQISG